jgi:chromate transporter
MIKGKLVWLIYLISIAITVITESEIIWTFLLAGVLVWFAEAPPKNWFKGTKSLAIAPVWLLAQTTIVTAKEGIIGKILLYFAEAGAFVFGSGLAIVPFLYGGVVKEFQWLTDKQFLDAVAVAMITPGACSDYDGVYWLFSSWIWRGSCGCCSNVFTMLFINYFTSTLL